MNRSALPKFIPAFGALAGIAAMLIRRRLYLTAVDATGRIVSGHPLSWALVALTVAVCAVCLLAVRSQAGPCDYESNFSRNTNARAGCFFFAFSIVFTVLTNDAPMAGAMGPAWKILGLASGACLALQGCLSGKKPPVALCLLLPLFLTAHLINHYQLWCSNPQLQDIFFPLFATVCLTVAAYQQAAFAADMGSRRQLLLAGSLAIYLCIAEASLFSYPTLYVSGAIWAGSNLCNWKEV